MARNEINGYPPDYLGHTALGREREGERRRVKPVGEVYRQAAAQIDAPGGVEGQRQIAGICREDANEQLDGLDRNPVALVGRGRNLGRTAGLRTAAGKAAITIEQTVAAQ